MSLRTRLLLGIVLVNLAAFSFLAVTVVRGVERRTGARLDAQQRFRDTVVELAQEFYVSFLADIDFGRMPLGRVLEQNTWKHARDAYITNFAYRVGEEIYLQGEIWLNPLGAHEAAAAALRAGSFDLVARAYSTERVQKEGDVVAIPLYSGPPNARERWGAAYIQVAVPTLPEIPEGMGLRVVALALGAATIAAGGLVFLLLHLLVLAPLGRIADGARRVSAGAFDVPVPRTGRDDEIDALIEAFNAMMAETGQKREALERRVEEVVARMRLTEQKLVLTDRLVAMGTLAAGIAHEINNPLGGMLNAVRSLRRRGVPETSERYLALVEDGLARVRDVVDRVRRFSPGRAMQVNVDLRDVVEDAARFVGHRLGQAGASVRLDVPRGLVLRGDPGALGQVFLNLFMNALDALDGEPREIRVRGRAGPEGVHVSVADTGTGMTEEQRRQAFNLFYTTKEAGKGTGLGLSIVHQIVREHGGSVEIESAAGEGTEVHMVFPPRRG